jgi:hypothetical protein
LIRTSYLVHQLPMRACLCEQKSYGSEVLAICNAYTLSLVPVLLSNLVSSEYYCIYFTRLWLTLCSHLLEGLPTLGGGLAHQANLSASLAH